MKIKPASKRGYVIVKMNRREDLLLEAGLREAKTAALPIKLKNILVPVDFSDCSRKALEYALPFARQFHAGITLLHIVNANYYPTNSDYTTFDYPKLMEEMALAGKKQLHALASSIAEKCPVETVIQTGHPGSVIVETAKQQATDLIIISTHGRTGFKRVFLGSTAEYAVRYASCPVLIVREHEHEFVQHQPLKIRRSGKRRLV